ncbi:MAG: GNAT family N-acetyltransferase [Nocardioidaceae bacterium]
MEIVAMTPAFAVDIASWRYPAPYDCYDMVGVAPDFLTDPANGYFALVSRGLEETAQLGSHARLIGFRSFGADGQVPGGRYDDSALDTGGGLRPDLTGHGLGREAISTGLDFGRRTYAPAAFRVTVASFNLRARRVVESLGFVHADRFEATTNAMSYDLFVEPERNNSPTP